MNKITADKIVEAIHNEVDGFTEWDIQYRWSLDILIIEDIGIAAGVNIPRIVANICAQHNCHVVTDEYIGQKLAFKIAHNSYRVITPGRFQDYHSRKEALIAAYNDVTGHAVKILSNVPGEPDIIISSGVAYVKSPEITSEIKQITENN